MNKSSEVFAIPELLQEILLSLPASTSQSELSSIRTIITCQSVCNTWRSLVADSKPIRNFCYLPLSDDDHPTLLSSSTTSSISTWDLETSSPLHIRHNPFIPILLLRQQAFNSGTWPFNANLPSSRYGPTTTAQHQRWSYFFEVSRSQFERFPLQPGGPWREMLVTEPAFHEAWVTRSLQATSVDSMLYKSKQPQQQRQRPDDIDDDDDDDSSDPYQTMDGAGWTPNMEAELRFRTYQNSKNKQRTRVCCERGFTLGAIVDGVAEAFWSDGEAMWVVVESVRSDDAYMSAEEK